MDHLGRAPGHRGDRHQTMLHPVVRYCAALRPFRLVTSVSVFARLISASYTALPGLLEVWPSCCNGRQAVSLPVALSVFSGRRVGQGVHLLGGEVVSVDDLRCEAPLDDLFRYLRGGWIVPSVPPSVTCRTDRSTPGSAPRPGPPALSRLLPALLISAADADPPLAMLLSGRSGQRIPRGAPVPGCACRPRRRVEVLRGAEKAHAALKSMAKPLADRQLIEEVQQGLPALVSSIDPLIGKGPLSPKQDLTDVRPVLQRADDTLSSWDDGFESAVQAVYENSQELRRMDEVWSLTEAQAREDGAPPAVLERVAALRASIDATAAQARTQLGQLLTTQNQVATVRMRIADALASVKEAEARQAEQLFEVESVPL